MSWIYHLAVHTYILLTFPSYLHTVNLNPSEATFKVLAPIQIIPQNYRSQGGSNKCPLTYTALMLPEWLYLISLLKF